MSNLSNMDNYIRILYLVFETAPYALGKLMLQYLNRTQITLSDLINKHQHEIYHYFTVEKCCICTKPPKCRSVIRKEQLMELFDTSPNAKRLTGHNYGSLPMCCCLAKPIVVEDLDFTLLEILMINFCGDEFWISFLEKYENDFEKFLSDERHTLFHLWKPNVICCECRTGYSRPDKSIIKPHQFKNMYVTIPSKCGNECTCHFKPEHGLTFRELKRRDKVLLTSLTNYFCNVQKAIEEISNIRNSRIAHVKSMDISKNEFESLWKLLKDSLLEIAASTQSETEITLRIQQCATRDLDIGMGQRWMRELFREQSLSKMIHERLKEDQSILDAKMDKCSDSIQSISTALASSNKREKEQSKMLCEHIQRTFPTDKEPQPLKDGDYKDQILSNQPIPEAFLDAIKDQHNLQEYSVSKAELKLILEKRKIQCRDFHIESKEGLELENTSSDEGSNSFFESETEWFYKLDLKCDNIDIHCIVDRRLERKYASLNSVYRHEPYGQHLIDVDPVTMRVNQLNQSTRGEFEQLYTMKSTVSDRTQLNLRHALVDASRQQFSMLCRWLMANIHNKYVINKEMESTLDIAFKNLDKDTAKAISWCITKTFYKTFQVNLSRMAH